MYAPEMSRGTERRPGRSSMKTRAPLAGPRRTVVRDARMRARRTAARGAGGGRRFSTRCVAAWRSSETAVLDRHGVVVQAVRTDLRTRRGAWVRCAVSPALRAASIGSEDQRFLEHSGVDWQAVAGATMARAARAGHAVRATITMQLAGLLDPRSGAARRSLVNDPRSRRPRQRWQIERTWTRSRS